MYHDLQINRLRALVTVVDLGGFRKAAAALHITQPAVSQQIRQLGTLIKGPVFVSTGRQLQLSPQGQELLGYARRILALNDEVADRFLPSASNVRVSIGVGDQLAEALPEILHQLTGGMPRAQFSVRTGLSEYLEHQVSAGQLDLALLLQPGPIRSIAICQELGRMRLDWFGQRACVESSTLPLTLYTEPSRLRNHVVDTLDAHDTPWSIGYEGAELVGLRAAAKAGLGLACLVANGDQLWGMPRTNELDLPAPPAPVPVVMAVGHGTASGGFVRTARRVLLNALSGYPFAD